MAQSDHTPSDGERRKGEFPTISILLAILMISYMGSPMEMCHCGSGRGSGWAFPVALEPELPPERPVSTDKQQGLGHSWILVFVE